MEARVIVLTLFLEIPKARWDIDRWIDIKAATSGAVADANATLGCKTSSQACSLIASIKPNLDGRLAAGQTA